VQREDLVAILAIVLGVGAGVIWIIFGTIYYTARTKAREQTKREIAAYVAEGSMDAKTAVAILNAGAVDTDEVRESCAELFADEPKRAVA
jgi:hypothetical protein